MTTAEFQDWANSRTIYQNGNVDLCDEAGEVTKHSTADRLYRIWWADGSRQTVFAHDEAEDMARRFNFDADLVSPGCDFYLLDDDGERVGGVVFEGWIS